MSDRKCVARFDGRPPPERIIVHLPPAEEVEWIFTILLSANFRTGSWMTSLDDVREARTKPDCHFRCGCTLPCRHKYVLMEHCLSGADWGYVERVGRGQINIEKVDERLKLIDIVNKFQDTMDSLYSLYAQC